MRNRVEEMEAVDLLKTIPTNTVGAVISDPPFFIGITGRQGGQGHDPWVDISTIQGMIDWSIPLAAEVHRVLRPGGASVIMGGSQSLAAWEVAAQKAGLVWMAELTVLWNTGKPRVRNFGSLITTIRWHAKPGAKHAFNYPRRTVYSNVLVVSKIPHHRHGIAKLHPAQKPVELTNFLVSLLSEEGTTIVDPFCGSGSTLVSAAICERPFIGGDIKPEYVLMAAKRVAAWELELNDCQPIYLWANGMIYPVES